MSFRHTPPHLAEPKLTYATEDDAEAYFSAIVHGFHDDYVAEHWEQEKKVAEFDRFFGFKVEDRWVATCGAYSRTMSVPGGMVPTAAVTIVTVAAAYRRRGLLTAMMEHQLEDVANRGNEPVALLWASESLIYGRFGYGHAAPRLRISGSTRSTGFLPTVEQSPGSVDEVSKEEFLASAPELRARLLGDRPGGLNRNDGWWDLLLYDPESWRDGASAIRLVLHFDAAGTVDGFAIFRVKEGGDSTGPAGEVQVIELDAADAGAYAALWRYVLDLDLVRTFVKRSAPVDEALRYLVADQRAIKTELVDGTYARIVDLPRALKARRYSRDLDVVIEVSDALLTHNSGRFRLQAGPDGASVTEVAQQPDLSVGIRELGAIYLGGTSLASLHNAGLVHEHTAGSVTITAAAFDSPRPPFCPDFF